MSDLPDDLPPGRGDPGPNHTYSFEHDFTDDDDELDWMANGGPNPSFDTPQGTPAIIIAMMTRTYLKIA